MKKYLIILIAIILLSCTKSNYTPINNEINTETCLDTCGIIIFVKHYMNDYPEICSELTIKTSCDTLGITRIHTMEEITYHSGDSICFYR